MRRHPTCQSVPALRLRLTLIAIGLSLSPAAARSQQGARTSASGVRDGNAVLTSRGLTRVGNLYLLREEINAKEKIHEGQDALKQMEAKGETLRQAIAQEQERLSSIDQELRTKQQERGGLNAQKDQLSQQHQAAQDANTRTSLANQMREVDSQIRDRQDPIDRLSQTLALAQPQLQGQMATLQELEAEYASKRSAYEQTFGYVKAKYQPMMNDPEIIQALRQLNRTARPWVMIGPQWEYDKNVRSLAQLVLKDAGLETSYITVTKRVGRRVTKVKVPRVSLAKQEKELRAVGYQARLLESKLAGPQGAANRQAMATAIAQLKKGVAEIEKAYTKLGKDTLITSAIELSAHGAKLEPTDEFKNYAKRLPELERSLKAKK